MVTESTTQAGAFAARDVIGRDEELGVAAGFLDRVSVGPAVLHLEGDAGIGKTTLWAEIVRIAAQRGYSVLQCRSTSLETSLAYVGLADLLVDTYEERADELPGPQRSALDAALLRSEPEVTVPDQRAASTGFLALLGLLSEDAPVVVAVDDVQWLDRPSARVLEFAVRRLRGRPIGILVSSRPQAVPAGVVGLVPEELRTHLKLGPLSLGTLYHLISGRLELALPRPTLLKVESLSGGNPMFALEIARVLANEGFPARGEPLPVPASLSALVSTKIGALPEEAGEAILVAAALSRPTTELVDVAALEPAVAAGVVSIRNGWVEFTHPLFSAAAYTAASPARRQQLHTELAEVVPDVEERARHLMRASSGPDGTIAEALHEAAEHAAQRGAPETAAELEEESARRTPPDSPLGPARFLRAAEHYIQAGDGERAREFAENVLGADLSPGTRAHALSVLAETCYRDRLPEAGPLLKEALSCVGDDPARAAPLELSLAFAALATGSLGEFELHARRSVQLAQRLGDSALLAEALAMGEGASFFMAKGFDDVTLARALELEDTERRVPLQLRASMNAAQIYEFACRFDRAEELYTVLRDWIVAHGEESDLPFLLVHLSACRTFVGDLVHGERYANEALDTAELVESELMRGFALMGRAFARGRRGDTHAAELDALESLDICERVGWPHGIFAARWALGFLALCEGDHAGAVEVLEPVVCAVEALDVYERITAMYLPDAIDALIATGDLERAEQLTEAIAECGRRLDRPWGLAASGRSRALLSAARGDVEAALMAVDEAVAQHERLTMPFERAQTLLVKGSLHRRAKQKRAARDTLSGAVALFEGIGAAQWAAKARAELARVGIRRAAPDELTETEQRVAELAASGLKNREIAAQAFLTPKSVEDVLQRVYRKLDIHSRAELGARMATTAGRG